MESTAASAEATNCIRGLSPVQGGVGDGRRRTNEKKHFSCGGGGRSRGPGGGGWEGCMHRSIGVKAAPVKSPKRRLSSLKSALWVGHHTFNRRCVSKCPQYDLVKFILFFQVYSLFLASTKFQTFLNKRLRFVVRIILATLNILSTVALDGIGVLNLIKSCLISG